MSSSSLRTAAVFAHGKWQNPFASWSSSIIDSGMKGYADIMKWQLTRRPPAPTTAELDQMLPVVPIDWAKLRNPPADKVQCTWIGHASFLIQMCGINLLTDPVFCNRVSPISFVGPARQRPTPCAISELPKIDAVVISHNHYDHLDASVVHALGNTARWFAPLGMKSWFEGQGVANVTEMTWWQETQFTPRVKMCCVPCSHWCKRTLFDTNKALWSSWAVVGDTARFYFAGDTGYCEAFQQIGDEYGPFDLAAIPIGAYEPRELMKAQHVNPEESVQIHRDLRSRKSVGMHWGTFILTDEPFFEPPVRVAAEMKRLNLPKDDFFVLNIGETAAVSDGTLQQPN
eukprot:TRINITY_DN1471_c0_g1_i1.p1 TRINITY_DN1471_c0_g1~~TRINITY_DN1471_c0_g1_i1.p1  ORF type:complete len:343 (+),score=52.18 TRINITY_DN1471_c0_g1_i1:49-1077(+)